MNNKNIIVTLCILLSVICLNLILKNLNFADESVNIDIMDDELIDAELANDVNMPIAESSVMIEIDGSKSINIETPITKDYPLYDNVGRKYLLPGEQFTWSNRCQSVRYESVFMKRDNYIGGDGEGEPNEAPPYEEIEKLMSAEHFRVTNPITGDEWGYSRGGFGLTGNKVDAKWINISIQKKLEQESIAKRDESRRVYEESTGNWTEEEKEIHESEMYELGLNWAAATHGMTPEEYLEWYETIPYEEYWVRDPKSNYLSVTKVKNLTPEELNDAIEYMHQIGEEPYK